eukprot:COSAG01_NODE_21974_length_877_cov_1.510283_1_plen_91_part_10
MSVSQSGRWSDAARSPIRFCSVLPPRAEFAALWSLTAALDIAKHVGETVLEVGLWTMEFMLPKTAIQSRSFPRSSHHSTVQPPLNRRWDQF